MSTGDVELEEIVSEYHHVQGEHRQTRPEGSGRRHMHDRLDELERRFEHLLIEQVGDEGERAAWRSRLHHGTEAPPTPALARPLAFRGRSSGGSAVEIRARPEGGYDVEIDGVPTGRLEDGEIDFAAYETDGHEFREVFEASGEALDALAGWVNNPGSEPPWEHLHDLLDDGLVDRHFGLTRRGRRALSHA